MNKKKITVIIEARTNSSRLPNKVIAKIEDKPMIFYVINRTKNIKSVEQVVLATTKEKNLAPGVTLDVLVLKTKKQLPLEMEG